MGKRVRFEANGHGNKKKPLPVERGVEFWACHKNGVDLPNHLACLVVLPFGFCGVRSAPNARLHSSAFLPASSPLQQAPSS